jgi:chorismate mutase/prephenate dehydratase
MRALPRLVTARSPRPTLLSVADAKRETEEARAEIARLDAQLLAALEKRARASRKLGELRKGQPASMPLGDRAALHALVARASGDLPTEAVREIFREIFSACLTLELPVKVAYLAPEGGPAHAAARGRFGASPNLVSSESTIAAIEEVARSRVEFAVVPLETRAEGPVQATIDALAESDLKIVATLEERWSLHLVNKTGNLADVEKVYATAADRASCARFIQSLGPRVSVLDVKSPLYACQLAVEDHGAGALATEVFAAALGLEVARKNVVDDENHRVRYAIIGRRPGSRTGSDLTSFVFSVDDAPGALLDVLKQFAE